MFFFSIFIFSLFLFFFAWCGLLSGSPWWKRTLLTSPSSCFSRHIGSCLKYPKLCNIISLIWNGKPATSTSIAVSTALCNTTDRSIRHEPPLPLPRPQPQPQRLLCMGRPIQQATTRAPMSSQLSTTIWTSLIFRLSPFCGTRRLTSLLPMNNEKQAWRPPEWPFSRPTTRRCSYRGLKMRWFISRSSCRTKPVWHSCNRLGPKHRQSSVR